MAGVGDNYEWWSLGIVAGMFIAMALIELVAPYRSLSLSKPKRWATNLALFALDTALVRIAIPLLMVGAAILAEERGWGLFNIVDAPGWIAVIASMLVLDLALYLQHWATHRVAMLWRLHKVHHSDPDFDVTTAARFHPFEIALSMLYKMAVVIALGAPALAVLVFEVLFTALTIFTHANIALPARLDRLARLVMVTPDMHRIHHSARRQETDSNYGTTLSGWDRLFGTYTAEAHAGQDGITIGLDEYQDTRPTGLGWSLLLPFRK